MKTTLVAPKFITGVVTRLLVFGRLRLRSAGKELRAKLETGQRPVEVFAGPTRDFEFFARTRAALSPDRIGAGPNDCDDQSMFHKPGESTVSSGASSLRPTLQRASLVSERRFQP